MSDTAPTAPRRHLIAGGTAGAAFLLLAIFVHPAFLILMLVAISAPMIRLPGQRPMGWIGLGFAVLAAVVFMGYSIGKDAALRDNAASESRQAP